MGAGDGDRGSGSIWGPEGEMGKGGGRGSPFRGFTILPFRVLQPLHFFWDFLK